MTGSAVDPVTAMLAVVEQIEPTMSAEVILGALEQSAARLDGRRRIAAAVTGRPDLLTGQGTHALFPGVLRFISALARAGATSVAEPCCPRCGRQRPLSGVADGLRICGGCRSKARALPCGRCGKVRSTARLNDGGKPICQNCWHRDPRSWKPCARCGNERRVAAITEAGPVCQTCRPGPDLPCSICGTAGQNRIGISRATGTPVCNRCRKRWISCSHCGTGAPLKGGTLREPLCARCLNPDPDFWKRCATCRETWQLSTAECTRCRLDRKLRRLLARPDGTAAEELDRLREALVRVDRPDHMMDWLNNRGVGPLLEAIAACGSVTHEGLDALPAGGTLDHLRSMMVAAGALPPRDERLAALERWISDMVAGLADQGHRRVLHGYAVWHHLRRLRVRLDARPASLDQARNIHDHVTAAAAFLSWLEEHGLSLAACTQAGLDQWLGGSRSQGLFIRSSNFIRWAVSRRHASGLTAPAARWAGPSGPLNQDRRWEDARRLLHEEEYTAADRVSGLLVLLYAQKLSGITALTSRHVRHEDDRTLLFLGSRPIVLPAPLDSLVTTLADGRPAAPGSSLLGVQSDWLFPGQRPGTALTEGALSRRLRAIAISPRQARSTALFTLAADVPAVILAKTLGIHVKAAVEWQKISAGDWTAYAADIGRRPSRSLA
ncbi:MAG TPA: hypothetical protein VMC83_42170 [Streptosporangiaceae bacterium]|nr:hypothetical protein [Streptosporangiaceae bacterium]